MIIKYSYYDQNRGESVGLADVDFDTAVKAAAKWLGAKDDGEGFYIYEAPKSRREYVCSETAMAELGAAVLSGRASAAYSVWHNFSGREVAPDWVR